MDRTYAHADLRRALRDVRTIAMVGASPKSTRPSFLVARFMARKGYRVIPVNPAYTGDTTFGLPFVADMSEIEGRVEMVDIFRRSSDAGAVSDDALEVFGARGLKTIWMQIGVVDDAAAARAEAAGVQVIMDRCPKMEYQRLFGELRWTGANTGVISSKLPPTPGRGRA